MPTDFLDQLARWWSTQLNWRDGPALWVLVSLASGLLARWLLWLAQRRGSRPATLPRPGVELATWGGWLVWLIGPGYAALLLGAASPRLMGLSQIDWGAGFGNGLAFALFIWAGLLLAGLVYRRTGPRHTAWPSLTAGLTGSVRLLVEAGALQWHWAFYRSAAIPAAAALGLAQASYWGTWLAAGLILAEGLANPFFWRDLGAAGQAERRILRAVLLLATSVLYLLSRNFWLAWACHAATALLLEPRLTSAR